MLQRDWFHTQARGYATMLDAALDGNAIPTSVVENLIAAGRAGVEPLRRYERLRKRVLGLESYHLYDGTIPLVEFDRRYPYHDVTDWIDADDDGLGHWMLRNGSETNSVSFMLSRRPAAAIG